MSDLLRCFFGRKFVCCRMFVYLWCMIGILVVDIMYVVDV